MSLLILKRERLILASYPEVPGPVSPKTRWKLLSWSEGALNLAEL
jgi:hypothetical protein